MTAHFNFTANVIVAGHAVTLVVDSRIATYEFIAVKSKDVCLSRNTERYSL